MVGGLLLVVAILLVGLFQLQDGSGAEASRLVAPDSLDHLPIPLDSSGDISVDTSGIPPTAPPFQPGIEFRQQYFDAFIFDPRIHEFSLFYRNETGDRYGNFQAVQQAVAASSDSLVFATNGGIFDTDFHPLGLTVVDGEMIQPLNLKEGSGNFYLQPNGVFYIDTDGRIDILETTAFADRRPEVRYAIQSGPLLLDHGQIHPAFNEGSSNLFVRSGVGILAGNRAVFIISRAPVNFFDFALFFKTEFGCEQALYLDGAISDIFVPQYQQTQRRPVNFSGIIALIEPPNVVE